MEETKKDNEGRLPLEQGIVLAPSDDQGWIMRTHNTSKHNSYLSTVTRSSSRQMKFKMQI